ncbi:putative serine protease K12H4.7 [Musca vetustissima]|uniref:putative serine protease K12H4.7 n=1 Tax=Musca vetustissima TaxID=27455 RepID=UPI002AB60930|nr:putative serine protease K12H4.7 [Musca vetustissima]
MKLKLTVVGLLAVTVAFATALEDVKDVPAFVRSFENLYRAPPLQSHMVSRAVKTDWITQKLDHFDEKDTRTWQMRYMTNADYFKPGGPMIIYIGGEWEISAGSISYGILADIAKEHNGMLFYTEHRYYGQSKPTKNLLVENLEYLHVKQALADLAHFIRYKHETVPELANSKVIIAGASYSATMVVWFKKLYPELVAGGWASSAPILAKVDFVEYKEVVGQALRELGSEKCYNRVQNGIAELEEMIDNKRAAEVKAMLKLCNNFNHNNDLDVWSLFGSISNIFAGYVQYQSEGDIPYICDYIMSFKDDLTAITNFFLFGMGFPSGCVDVSYKSTVNYYKDSTYVYGASRPWYFQTCNEYGWYQTSGSRNQPFGTKFPVTFYTTLCTDVFGRKYSNEQINKLADQTNADFGGMNPEVENVYMTHGALDPWSPMGHGLEQGASVIPRASHCADFGSISSADSPEMRASKEKLLELVREWLK